MCGAGQMSQPRGLNLLDKAANAHMWPMLLVKKLSLGRTLRINLVTWIWRCVD
jgi:hypothetical protein